MHTGPILQDELVDDNTLWLADSRDDHVDDLLGLEQTSKLTGSSRIPFPNTKAMNGPIERASR